MKKLLILVLFSFCLNAYAEKTDNYVIEKPDGSVAVVHYLPGSSRSLESVLDEQGLLAFPIYSISESELKKLDRKDRKYWKKQGSKIVIDADKKLEDLNAEAVKDQEKESILEKLKITEEEAQVLGEVIQ